MTLGTASILRGDALNLALADGSVDLIVTSPPYFGLRSYQDGGEHYAGQIGAEPTPAEFVDALVAATAEMVRVLKPSGSIWVNLGDKYASSSTPGPQSQNSTMTGGRHKGVEDIAARRLTSGVPTKSLIGIPWRYAIRCIDDLGLILRAEVIWSKPNGLPESVTDRVRRSHETWFHFTKEPRYFSAVDEIREEHVAPNRSRGESAGLRSGAPYASMKGHTFSSTHNILGKLPGSVWTIATQPLKVPADLGIDHFAAFPMEWPRRIIRGWSPREVCSACGEGRRPVSERNAAAVVEIHHNDAADHRKVSPTSALRVNGADYYRLRDEQARRLTGYACACPNTSAPATPGIVLDPFGGTGTTALVAKTLGRHGITNDMSADYCRLAQWRTNDPGELARAMQVDKPAEQIKGQADLFDLFDGEAS